MRYAQGGGLTTAERDKREQVRLAAGGRFAEGASVAQVAQELRVNTMSANRWRRSWLDGGRQALVSISAGGVVSKLDLAAERPTLTICGTLVYVKGKSFFRQEWTK